MKTAFAYIRVSTTKQGREGASLPEQRDSIEKFCERNNIQIVRWFEESESAAGRGRLLFAEMMKLVKKGKAEALVFHKIDRSTRNLSEWADVSSLPEQGIDVHYSHEPVDLTTLHGRTAADVAAVFATAYIRNLKQEVKKGLDGRLKQGIYPFKAPLGYLDNGGGKLKTIDPVTGPLVREMFELYGRGESSFADLIKFSVSKRLLGNRGSKLCLNGLSCMLHNPFYIGLIHIKRTGMTYTGKHEPLISPALFKKVENLMAGKVPPRAQTKGFLLSRLILCESCGHSIIGESQRGLVYYRCHNCKGVSVRQDDLFEQIQTNLSALIINEKERTALNEEILQVMSSGSEAHRSKLRLLTLQIGAVNSRLNQITDAYLDGTISKENHEERKLKHLKDKRELEVEKQNLEDQSSNLKQTASIYLEHAISLQDNYFRGNDSFKRQLLKTVTSNISIQQKTLVFKWEEPFLSLVKRRGVQSCALSHGSSRRHLKKIDQHLLDCECQKDLRMSIVRSVIEKVAAGARIPELYSTENPPFPPSAPSPRSNLKKNK
jgi:site-specific DNA recombinase